MIRALPHLALAALAYGCAASPAPSFYADTRNTDPARVAALPDSWPCGEGTCLDALSWHPISAALSDALAEGDTEGATTRDWTLCWESIGPTSYYVCADGTVETS